MKCSWCGGDVIQYGSDAYRIFYRCRDCGKEIVTPKK